MIEGKILSDILHLTILLYLHCIPAPLMDSDIFAKDYNII